MGPNVDQVLRESMSATTINLGVAGLGRAFMLMLPTFIADSRIRLVACADPRADARARFEAEYGGRSHDSVDALCADPAVDVVYLSTPHQFHAAHVVAAVRHGKHVVVEKPMAITLEECATMIEAAASAGIQLIVGHSHSSRCAGGARARTSLPRPMASCG